MITLLKPIGPCFGVINAVKIAKDVKKQNKDKNIYIFGLLVHNEEVTKSLNELDINTIDTSHIDVIKRLKEFNKDDIVIFTAHGHPSLYEEILNKNHVKFYDATCPKVKECFNLIKKAKETIYIGKKNHPEANAALTMNDNVHFYDINEDFDYQKIKENNPLVINQTTLSFLELNNIHQEIKSHLKEANIVDEICDATLLRQKAIKDLDDSFDTLLIVGSKRSSNTMKLYELAKSIHQDKQIIHVENLAALKDIKFNYHNLAITSGTSTPIETVNQIKRYLEDNGV